MAILFHFQDAIKPSFFKTQWIKTGLKKVAQIELFTIDALNYIFVSDEELLKINIDYLQHNTYTDIITFDNSDAYQKQKNKIEGDIFISIERVEENALKFKTTFEQELMRVMAHGLLHLCGYKDKSKSESIEMRNKENEALQILFSAK